jgi:hypothetical protein
VGVLMGARQLSRQPRAIAFLRKHLIAGGIVVHIADEAFSVVRRISTWVKVTHRGYRPGQCIGDAG